MSGSTRKCGCTCPDVGCDRAEGDTHCWSLQYLHMNHFFTHTMWTRPELEDFDYFMRIDADLYLQNELPFDPFEKLRTHGCKFGTGKEGSDMRGCYEGQLQATRDWAQAMRHVHAPTDVGPAEGGSGAPLL